MTTSLPSVPSLEQLRKQAKDLVKGFKALDPEAVRRVRSHLPRAADLPSDSLPASGLTLSEAQLVVAREYEFPSWSRLKRHVESSLPDTEAAMKAFVEAVNSGDAKKLRVLLRSVPALKAHIEDPIFSFDSPAIVAAAGRRNREIVDVLLENGADINARSKWWAGGFGVLPNDDPDFARFLVERGADVDIWAAAGMDRLDRLEELVREAPERVNARGGDGMAPLHFAASVEIARFLLDHGADVDMRDLDHNGTPAQTLVTERPEIARYLLSRGAELDIYMAVQLGDLDLVKRALALDPDALSARVGSGKFTSGDSKGGHIYLYKLKNGHSPVFLAAELGNRAIYEYLVSLCSPAHKLVAACYAADRPAVQAVLAEHPGLVSTLPARELSALPYAAWLHKTESVRLMLEIGFNIEARGSEDSTALNRAAVRGFADLIGLLLEHGASLDAKNIYGGRPLPACLWGAENFRDPNGDYVASVEKLLAAGASLSDIRYPSGNKQVNALLRRYLDRLSRTSLIAAIRYRNEERIRMLLERNRAIVNELENGMLPLFQAVRTIQPEIVRLLLDHGADPLLKEVADGPIAADVATDLGRADVAEMLHTRR